MAYATLGKFRKLTNISKDIVSDGVLQAIFLIADRLVNKIISTPVKLENLEGPINGTNKDFRTNHSPLADTTLGNTTLLDSCDVITDWTKGGDAAEPTAIYRLVYGSNAVSLAKSGSSTVTATWTKTKSATVDGTGRKLRLTIYIKDISVLSITDAMEIRIGNDDSNYYSITFARKQLKNGINEFDLNLDTSDMGETGTLAITTLDYMYIEYSTIATTTTVAAGEIIMDYWRLEDIDSPDTSDLQVFYSTYDDSTGFRELGSAQTITSLQEQEGIITMTTAPTTTTAEAGVYGTYAYTSDNMDFELVNSASCYMAAHIAGLIISGESPNYSSIAEGWLRKEVSGRRTFGMREKSWINLCYFILEEAVGHGATGIGMRSPKTRDVA